MPQIADTVPHPHQLPFPGAVVIIAMGINPGGAIVGQYTDTNGQTHGLLAVPMQGHNQ